MPEIQTEQLAAGISRAEYAGRVATALERARDRGAEAILVLGRGGGPFERHGDLQYLTGHYPVFPAIPDHPGHWRLRGHAAALIDDDSVTLLTDDEIDPASVASDSIGVTPDLVDGVAHLLAAPRTVAMVGGEILGAGHLDALQAAAGATWVAAPDLLVEQRLVKSPAEQDLLRAAANAGVAAIGAALAAAEGGAAPQEAAAEAMRAASARGAAIANVFAGAYGPDRPVRSRHFPPYADSEPPAPGEVFTIDMSGALDGYFFDFSRSVVVGDDRYGAAELIADARAVVEATVDALRPGVTAGEATEVGYTTAADRGHEIGGEFAALGHGLGLGFEAPWLTTDNPLPLRAGMSIAVERMLFRGPIGATFEHDVILTSGAPEVLTERV